MTGRSMFDTPTVVRLLQLLEEVRTGGLLIPDFQRPFEWDNERRLLLLDSIAKGMPIGSFLVWRTREHNLRTYERLGPFRLPSGSGPGELRTYLLDGHQRITTLFAALSWTEDPDAPRELEDEGVRWPIYYDLDAEAFTLHRGQGAVPATWLPLSKLLAPARLYGFQKSLMDQQLFEASQRAEALANIFKDYLIPIVPLRSEDLDLVTDSFVRVNNQGKPMRETYMVRALAYSQFDIQKRLDTLRQRLAPRGWGAIDDQWLLNALKVRFGLDVYSAGPRELYNKLQGEGYEASFDSLEQCMGHAVEFLRTCGVCGPAALPYAYQLIALAEAARHMGGSLLKSDVMKLESWFWATTYTGYFTGMTGNKIRDAITHVSTLVCNGGPALPADLPREVPALTRYRYNATRSRAFVLLLANWINDEAIREEAAERLGELGPAAVDKLIPDHDGDEPANRVVTTPRQLVQLRLAVEALVEPGQGSLMGPTATERAALLKRYIIPVDACRDVAELLLRRQADLDALELDLLQKLGLTLARR